MRAAWISILLLLVVRSFAVEAKSDRPAFDERAIAAIAQADGDRDSGSSSSAPFDLDDDDDDDDGDLILPATHDPAPLLVVERRPTEAVALRDPQHEPSTLFRPPRVTA